MHRTIAVELLSKSLPMKLAHEVVCDPHTKQRDGFSTIPIVPVIKLVRKIERVRSALCALRYLGLSRAPSRIAADRVEPIGVLGFLVVAFFCAARCELMD